MLLKNHLHFLKKSNFDKRITVLLLLMSPFSESAVRRCSAKYLFWKILQNSQKNTCAGVSVLIKWQA